MKVKLSSCLALVAAMLWSALLYAAPQPHYLITNNDFSQANSATFFTIGDNHILNQTAVVPTGGTGVSGIGAVATKRVSILDRDGNRCAFISDAGSADVAGISIATLTASGAFKAASTDSAPFGVPVGNNGKFLYAGFTGSQTIATYQILPGCKLQFIQDVPAAGIAGGSMIDLSVHEDILVASFQDGSIESFNISAGVPVANGDLQQSTGSTQNNNIPSGVDISADGHYALFGGTNVPPVVEVSDISSGKLAPTVVYSNLGTAGGSEAIWLSPDESLLYLSDFSSSQITAASFDKNTGDVTFACVSPALKGAGPFEAGLVTATSNGTGRTVLVAEPNLGIASVRISPDSGTCSLTEAPNSPTSNGMFNDSFESVGVFPPRRF